jgi:hypothetical protein
MGRSRAGAIGFVQNKPGWIVDILQHVKSDDTRFLDAGRGVSTEASRKASWASWVARNLHPISWFRYPNKRVRKQIGMEARCTSKRLITLLNDLGASGNDLTCFEALKASRSGGVTLLRVSEFTQQLAREITYRVLVGPQGHGLRPLVNSGNAPGTEVVDFRTGPSSASTFGAVSARNVRARPGRRGGSVNLRSSDGWPRLVRTL